MGLETMDDTTAEPGPEAGPEAGPELEIGPHRPAIAPGTIRDLTDRTRAGYAWAYHSNDWQDLRAGRWEFADTWLRLIAALTSSLSALSIFAGNAVVTGSFVLVAAVTSTLNAALDPGQRSRRHRIAARRYRHLENLFYALGQRIGSGADLAEPGPGIAPLVTELMALEEAIEEVDDDSPAVSRLRSSLADHPPAGQGSGGTGAEAGPFLVRQEAG